MLSRATLPKRSVTLLSRRLYSSEKPGSAGATASSKGFGEKEKAVENQWARKHDAEKLKALHEELEKQKKVTDSIQKDLDELKKSVDKK